MATGRAIEAGQAFVRLFADDSELKRGLNATAALARGWGASIAGVGAGIAGVGAGILGALGGAVNSATDYGAAVSQAAARTGLTTDEFQKLQFAAEATGVSVEDLEGAFRHLEKSGRGGGMASFLDAVDQVQHSANPAAAAIDTFGKKGYALQPLLQRGAAGVRELADTADRLGYLMGGEDVEAAREFAAALKELQAVGLGAWRQIGSALIPALLGMTPAVTKAAGAVARFVKDNRELAVGAAILGALLVAGGAALVGVGFAAVAASAGITVFTTAMTVMGGVVAVVKGLLYAEVIIPLLAVAAAYALAAGAAYLFFSRTEAGRGFIRAAGQDLEAFGGRMMALFRGLSDALSTGDFDGAWKLVTLQMDREWTNVIAKMYKGFLFFGDAIPAVMDAAAGKVGDAMTDMAASVHRTFADLIAGIRVMWLDFSTFFKQLAVDAANKAAQLVAIAQNPLNALPGRVAAKNQEAAAEKAQLAAERDAAKAAVLDELKGDNAAANAARDAMKAAAEKARKDRADARKIARDDDPAAVGLQNEVDELERQIAAIQKQLADNRKKFQGQLPFGAGGIEAQVRGTFGGGTARGELGANDRVGEVIARNTEEALQHQKFLIEKSQRMIDILDRIERKGGAAFA